MKYHDEALAKYWDRLSADGTSEWLDAVAQAREFVEAFTNPRDRADDNHLAALTAICFYVTRENDEPTTTTSLLNYLDPGPSRFIAGKQMERDHATDIEDMIMSALRMRGHQLEAPDDREGRSLYGSAACDRVSAAWRQLTYQRIYSQVPDTLYESSDMKWGTGFSRSLPVLLRQCAEN